jgi:hypothetical protein
VHGTVQGRFFRVHRKRHLGEHQKQDPNYISTQQVNLPHHIFTFPWLGKQNLQHRSSEKLTRHMMILCFEQHMPTAENSLKHQESDVVEHGPYARISSTSICSQQANSLSSRIAHLFRLLQGAAVRQRPMQQKKAG